MQYILQHTSLVVTELFGTRRGLRLSVTFSRRWLFYVINSIVPVLTLSLLNTIVFLLPAHSGERVRVVRTFSVQQLVSLLPADRVRGVRTFSVQQLVSLLPADRVRGVRTLSVQQLVSLCCLLTG